MEDVRSLYINQILNHYRKTSPFDDSTGYYVNYRHISAKEPTFIFLKHNEGLDVVKNYIKDLEHKVDELQHIERIIRIAKENKL